MKFKKEDKIGILITVILHLAVIITLLFSRINYNELKETSFLLDFSKQEIKEKEETEKAEMEKLHSIVKEKIEKMLSGEIAVPSVRNTAVNLSSNLKDDRNTDVEQLYKDAEDISRKLKEKAEIPDGSDYAEVPSSPVKEEKNGKSEYKGPSVISYFLDGRKASRLPIPAYKCIGGGIVTVLITVDNAGNVINAKIQEETSSDDKCLRAFAIKAAKMSKFSISQTAPAKQGGNIVYQFIAQ